MSKFNYFKKVLVSNNSFPDEPQVDFGFNSQGFSLLNKGSAIIEYSFNGNDLHGELDPNDASAGITFDTRIESKIWFRLGNGESGNHIVRIEAWKS